MGVLFDVKYYYKKLKCQIFMPKKWVFSTKVSDFGAEMSDNSNFCQVRESSGEAPTGMLLSFIFFCFLTHVCSFKNKI